MYYTHVWSYDHALYPYMVICIPMGIIAALPIGPLMISCPGHSHGHHRSTAHRLYRCRSIVAIIALLWCRVRASGGHETITEHAQRTRNRLSAHAVTTKASGGRASACDTTGSPQTEVFKMSKPLFWSRAERVTIGCFCVNRRCPCWFRD